MWFICADIYFINETKHIHIYMNRRDNKCLALIAQVVRVFGMNPKVGGSSPLMSRRFLSLNLRHFHKNIRSWVENECFYPRTVNISNVNFFQKYLYRQSQYSNTSDSKCLAPIAQVVRAFGMNPKVGGSSPLQVDTFSVSKYSTRSQEHPFMSRN